MKARAFLQAAINLGIGLLAAILLLILATAVHTIHSVAAAAFIAAGVVFAAACVRLLARPQRPWSSGIALGVGSCIPVVLVGILLFSAGTKLILWVVVAGFLLIGITGAWAGSAVRRARYVAAGLAVALACACAMGLTRIGEHTLRAYSRPVLQNRAAPKFVLTDVEGHAIPNATLKGHIVVLDFWATWCAPCLREMPTVGKVRQSFGTNPTVIFYAVNPGWNEAGDDKVKAFVAQHRFSVPLAFDEGGQAIHSFGATSLPFLVVLDRSGNIRLTASGFDTASQLERDLTAKINELLAAR